MCVATSSGSGIDNLCFVKRDLLVMIFRCVLFGWDTRTYCTWISSSLMFTFGNSIDLDVWILDGENFDHLFHYYNSRVEIF